MTCAVYNIKLNYNITNLLTTIGNFWIGGALLKALLPPTCLQRNVKNNFKGSYNLVKDKTNNS